MPEGPQAGRPMIRVPEVANPRAIPRNPLPGNAPARSTPRVTSLSAAPTSRGCQASLRLGFPAVRQLQDDRPAGYAFLVQAASWPRQTSKQACHAHSRPLPEPAPGIPAEPPRSEPTECAVVVFALDPCSLLLSA